MYAFLGIGNSTNQSIDGQMFIVIKFYYEMFQYRAFINGRSKYMGTGMYTQTVGEEAFQEKLSAGILVLCARMFTIQ